MAYLHWCFPPDVVAPTEDGFRRHVVQCTHLSNSESLTPYFIIVSIARSELRIKSALKDFGVSVWA